MNMPCPKCRHPVYQAEQTRDKVNYCPQCGHPLYQDVDATDSSEDVWGYDAISGPEQSSYSGTADRGTQPSAPIRKLRHEANHLNRALVSQYEMLGTLTLQHRPSQITIDAESDTLARLEKQRQERESANSEAIEKSEDLDDQMREVRVSIGRKTFAARPDMPGAAGRYSTIERLEKALAETTAQLAELDAKAQRRHRRSLKGPLLTIVGLAVLIGLIVLVVVPLGDRLFGRQGVPDWAMEGLPDTPRRIAFVDVNALRHSVLWEESDDMRAAIEQDMKGHTLMPAEDIGAVVIPMERIALIRRRSGQIVRFNRALDLEEVIDCKVQPEKYHGFDYCVDHYGNAAGRINGKTFCVGSAGDVKAVLRQYEEREQPEFEEDLQTVLNKVGAHDMFVVSSQGSLHSLIGFDSPLIDRLSLHPLTAWAVLPLLRLDLPAIDACGIGASLDSTMTIDIALVMKRDKDADRMVEQSKEFIEEFKDDLDDEFEQPTPRQRRVFYFFRNFADSIRVARAGDLFTAKIKLDLREAINLHRLAEDGDRDTGIAFGAATAMLADELMDNFD